MNKQPQRSSPAQVTDIVREQQIDRFNVFSGSPTQSPNDTFHLEPAVVTTTSGRAWITQDLTERPKRTSPGQQNALALLMNAFPTGITHGSQNQVVPTAIAMMMTKSNRHRSPSILERYAQTIPLSASCQSVQKRCLFPDCSKMSVSKGLCRGHGGGRRCHFAGGCTKSAQSRSMFCWAHGGGQRCDVETCMRSRKTKHFCVAHMHLETKETQSSSSGKSSRVPRTRRNRYVPVRTRTHRQSSQRMLPSLGQALSAASLSPPSFPILPCCLDE